MQPTIAECLEPGDIVRFERCPFWSPPGDALALLRSTTFPTGEAEPVSCLPALRELRGTHSVARGERDRLLNVLTNFAAGVGDWLAKLLPEYARAWRPGPATWRHEEEAVRRSTHSGRNDLLQLDAVATQPTGARLLRVFVNLHESDPRVWATSDTFASLLERYGDTVGLPGRNSSRSRWGQGLLSLFRLGETEHSEYDRFMRRLADFLKSNDDFQERAPRRLWRFQPGEAWIAFTDGMAYAELRGQYALEQSFFVPTQVLAKPELAPVSLLEKVSGQPLRQRAA